MKTTTLFRPVGSKELELIEYSGWIAFPPRLPEQPIFHPVLNKKYAAQIAKEWSVRETGAAYVTQFEVRSRYVAKFKDQTIGSSKHKKLWVPADEFDEFNRNIVGKIEIVAEFHAHNRYHTDI